MATHTTSIMLHKSYLQLILYFYIACNLSFFKVWAISLSYSISKTQNEMLSVQQILGTEETYHPPRHVAGLGLGGSSPPAPWQTFTTPESVPKVHSMSILVPR